MNKSGLKWNKKSEITDVHNFNTTLIGAFVGNSSAMNLLQKIIFILLLILNNNI